MRGKDIEAVGDLLSDGADATGSIVEETHAAIAKRTFDAIGPMAEPVRAVHDGIASAVYRSVRGSLKAASTHGSRALAARADPNAPALTDRPVGGLLAGAVNGIWGDHLARRASPLAVPMELRTAGASVPATPDALAAAFPAATPRIAVFLHGLCETDEAWRGLPPRDQAKRAPSDPTADPTAASTGTDPAAPYGERLREDLGFTPIYVRYNSGLRISANGHELTELLDAVAAAWPTEVTELVLVGHSMGGLVARSACHYAEAEDRVWAGLVRHVFCLGTPHLGADLEKGVHLLDWALGMTPETRAFSGALRSRSVGVKDLRFGAVADVDWHGHDPDEFLRDRCQETPFLPGAHYYFVSAQLAPSRGGHVFGDLLVRTPSASGAGKGRTIPFDAENGHTLPGLSHFDLLNHPAVYDQLRLWIERAESTTRA